MLPVLTIFSLCALIQSQNMCRLHFRHPKKSNRKPNYTSGGQSLDNKTNSPQIFIVCPDTQMPRSVDIFSIHVYYYNSVFGQTTKDYIKILRQFNCEILEKYSRTFAYFPAPTKYSLANGIQILTTLRFFPHTPSPCFSPPPQKDGNR